MTADADTRVMLDIVDIIAQIRDPSERAKPPPRYRKEDTAFLLPLHCFPSPRPCFTLLSVAIPLPVFSNAVPHIAAAAQERQLHSAVPCGHSQSSAKGTVQCLLVALPPPSVSKTVPAPSSSGTMHGRHCLYVVLPLLPVVNVVPHLAVCRRYGASSRVVADANWVFRFVSKEQLRR